jgi:hypothetical protein
LQLAAQARRNRTTKHRTKRVCMVPLERIA